MSTLRPKRITDRNGRATTVYVKDDAAVSPRISIAPTPAIPAVSVGAMSWEIAYNYMDDSIAVAVDDIIAVMKDFETQYGDFKVGRTRAVFDRGDGFVLKVVINDEGVLANHQ